MTPERWTRIKELFVAARSKPSSDWAAFLEEACAGDDELRRSVDELLEHSDDSAQLESPWRFPSLVNTTVGHYRILGELGRGGMAVVYKAKDTLLGRTVALKFLSPEITPHEEFKSRFIQEAKAAAAFDHPNICTLYGIEEVDGRIFLVMAYVGAKTVRERIKSGPIPMDEVLRIGIEVALGLKEAHRMGIVHRDIKPSNILLCTEGRTLISDFGLAQFKDQARVTHSGGFFGTPAYMSPEQIAGGKVDQRSDIWSFGVVLYEMASGRLPFTEEPVTALLLAIQTKTAPALTSNAPHVPVQFSRVVSRMLARNPDDRYQNVGDLLGHLQALRDKRSPDALNFKLRAGARGVRAFLAAMMGAALLSAWYFLPTGTRVDTRPDVTPISSYAGMEDSPSFSPDGEQIAFSWQSEEKRNSDICVKLVRDITRVCLTSDPRPDVLPAWSPTGEAIAFLRVLSPEKLGVYVVSRLGGQERQLAEIESRETRHVANKIGWTPDGKGLVISDRDAQTRRFRLWLLSLDTLERRPLTTPPADSEGDRNPAVSFDGRSVAFVRESNLFGDVYIQTLSAEFEPIGEPRRVTFDNQFIVDPVWIGESDELLFASASALSLSGLRLWRVSAADGGRPRREDIAGEGVYSPAVSRDGRRMAFTRFENDQNVWRLDRDAAGRWGAPQKFSRLSSTRDDGLPAISPDGGRIAFVSNRAGQFDIWISNADGSNAFQRTFLGSLSGTLAWSPDGKQIAFDGTAEGNWDVYVVGADGGQPRRLTTSSADESVANWSIDGSQLYFNSNETGEYQIWKMPGAGGAPVQVTPTGGYFAFESADGKHLYYSVTSETGPLRRLTLETGADEAVIDVVSSICFAVTKTGVFFFTLPDALGGTSLRFLDFGSNRVSTVATMSTPVSGGISVSPDEKTILYSQRDQMGSDLFLVDDFR